MAIPFLNNINLDDNQLLNAKLQVTGTVPAAEQGQIYFNSATGFLKPRVHDGTDWLNLLDTTSILNGTYITSNVTNNVDITLDLSAVNGTAVAATRFLSKDNTWDIPVFDDYVKWNASDNVTTEPVTTNETIKWIGAGTTGVVLSGGVFTITSNDEFDGTVKSVSTTHGGNAFTASIGGTAVDPSVDIAMAGTSSQYIDGTGDLATFPTIPTVSNATITLISGNGLANGGQFNLNQAANKLITFNVGAGNGIVANLDDVAIDYSGSNNIIDAAADGTTIVTADKIIYEDATDSIVKEISVASLLALAPQGDVTGIDAGTYISIADGGTATPTVNALGTATPYVSATDDSKLVARDANGYAYVKTPASGDSTTKIATTAFVQAAVTGLLEFKGGFNANTGAIVGGGNLTSGATRVALAVGDYYVVTVAGNFFGNAATPLTPGDSVIVQTLAAVGTSVEGDFIVVQSDTDLATLTTVGIGNVGNAGVGTTTTYSNGTATITNTDKGSSQNIFKNVASSSGTAVADNNNDTLTIVGAGGISTAVTGDTLTITSSNGNSSHTYAETITDTDLTIDHNLGTRDIIVQLFDTVTFETVYADVDRITVDRLGVTFSVTPTNSVRVLIQKIG